MVNHKWTTGEQETYLQELIPSYVEHKAANTLTLFWDRVHREWFDRYPVEDARFPSHPEYDTGTQDEIRGKKMKPMKDVRILACHPNDYGTDLFPV